MRAFSVYRAPVVASILDRHLEVKFPSLPPIASQSGAMSHEELGKDANDDLRDSDNVGMEALSRRGKVS
jgi:hypothetical protein